MSPTLELPKYTDLFDLGTSLVDTRTTLEEMSNVNFAISPTRAIFYKAAENALKMSPIECI